MTQERRRWSIVSKSARGLYLLDADLKREFRREGVNPTGKCMNLFHSAVYAGYTFLITTHTFSLPPPTKICTAWVWPDRMSVYLHMNHNSETLYSERGPGAHEALASGNVPASFRGLPVYTSYPIDTDFNGVSARISFTNAVYTFYTSLTTTHTLPRSPPLQAPISLLERDRMCGEYFYICHGEDIAIFSAEHDKFITITYAQAAAADVRFKRDADGTKSTDLAELKDKAGNQTATEFAKFEAHGTSGAKAQAHQANPPILIFRPFQTVSVFPRLPVARSYLSHNPSLFFLFAITVDNGVVHPAQGRVGARQHVS